MRKVRLIALSALVALCASAWVVTAGSAAGARAAKAPSGKPIVIGTICGCSGTAASSEGGFSMVATAWQSFVNANGGINGHPVKVIVYDDQSNAATSQLGAKTLIQQDHVMAIAGEWTSFDAAWGGYVTGTGVPVVGGQSVDPPFESSADFFPSSGDLPAALYGMLAESKKAGKTKVAVLTCVESPICSQAGDALGRMAKVVGGISVVYNTGIAYNAPSFTAQCLAAQGAGADALFTIDSSAIVTEVADQCALQGYKPVELSTGGSISSAWASDPNMNGALMTVYDEPIHTSVTPGINALHAALEKYSPSLLKSAVYVDSLVDVWSGLELFRTAAVAGKLGPSSTPAEVKSALYTLKNVTLGGLTPPLTFVKGKPTRVDCYFALGLNNNNWSLPSGPKPICLSKSVGNAATAAYNA